MRFRLRVQLSAALFSTFIGISHALACGGTFCDSPPPGKPPMPVEQTGENVVFVMTEGFVEAHVQIQYSGDPARFAWLVPVPAVPEVSVGSDQLFLNLRNGSVPTFRVTNSADSCSGGARTTSGGCGFGAGAASEQSASFNGTGSDSGPRTQSDVVVQQETVGAFDVTVLQATNASDVTAWLDSNGFLNVPQAPSLLQDYVDRGHVFVAVKLQPGAGVNEIHPLVIRYAGNEPCIPLKLTQIAATPDMGVRAFFLGDRRVVPVSYREVTLNPARLDWVGTGENYNSVVSLAVDGPGGDGHAFVTEYAGSSSIVSSADLFDPRWDSSVFRTASPESVIDLLKQQGLVTCAPGQACVTNHPLVLPIVRKYVPAPPGVPEAQFYSCLSCNSASIDQKAWNGDAFANELDDRVIKPGRHAADVLSSSPYLTRLFTTISPEEMSDDPTFAEASASEPTVSDQWSGNINLTCGGQQAAEAPGLPPIALDGSQMPSFDQKMPYASTVRRYDTSGHGTLVYDNTTVITDEISRWNASQGFPRAGSVAGNSMSCGCVLGAWGANPGQTLALFAALAIARRLRRRAQASSANRLDGHRAEKPIESQQN